MKSKSIILGIFLSVAFIVTAAGFYWMAVQTKSGEHHLAISTVRRIQQLESQWSVEVARVRSDPFADFDSLTQFIPRMDRLKETLSDAIRSTPSLPDRLANTTNAYLSAITAKEERIERFKTGYAVLRNSVRYLPLAATNVMQQMQTQGSNSAFIKNVATITDEINTYLASPAPPEKERLTRVLADLGDNIATRHPVLVNTAMNFVAHGQVLLEKQAPTEEIFQEATSDQISDLGETIIKGLDDEIDRTEALAAWYERGIIGMGVALWVMWLTIAFRMPKGRDQARRGGAVSLPQNSLLLREQVGPRPDEGLDRLTADLMKTGRINTEEADSTAAAEFTAYQVGVDIAAAQLVALAERINSSTEVLTELPGQPADNGAEAADLPGLPVADEAEAADLPGLPTDNGAEAAADTPDEDRDAVAAVVASIHAQTNDIVELAKRLPALAPRRDEGYAQLDLNDYIDEIADSIQAKGRSLVIKELNPLPSMLASEPEVCLIFANIMENAALAIQERGQKKGIIQVETKQENESVIVTVADNGVGIRPERRKRVFQPFYTTREGALGMGLTITQNLVEKYGGSIVMNSMHRRGTVVRVTLPIRAHTQ